jgi:hypothetical protein
MIGRDGRSPRAARDRRGASRAGFGRLLSFGLALAACGEHSTYVVAAGSKGHLATTLKCASSKSAIADFDAAGGVYDAHAAGEARLSCTGGSVTLDVRKIARLEIDGPRAAPHDSQVFYRVRAFDAAGGELMLGDRTPIDWQIPAGVERSTSCGDIMPICPSDASAKVRSEAGERTIGAALDGVSATLDVTFE